MTGDDRKIEEIVKRSLNLKDKGKTNSYILSLFPEQKEELSDIFMITDILESEKGRIKPSKDLLKKIISKSNGKNTTESIRKVTNNTANRYKESKDNQNMYDYILKITNKGRVSLFSKLFNIIQSNMNKKLLSGVSVILLLLVIGSGLIIIKRRGAPVVPGVNRFAIENNIDDEINSFDQDIKDIDELENDTIIEDVNGDLSEINSDIKQSLPPDVTSLDAMERELAYELDSFLSDFENSAGIENDTSLNSLSSQMGGISS